MNTPDPQPNEPGRDPQPDEPGEHEPEEGEHEEENAAAGPLYPPENFETVIA